MTKLRKLIKDEGYFQSKIKKSLEEKYPDAFIRKISQGAYSEGGIPDILMIRDGHYFGFEVKRPVVGIRSKLQEQTVRMIQAAGGTAAFVCWPEEAIREVEEYEKSQG
ncbi:VRR-NUC domain-containing protein [Fusicatenibacter saccharivorans]|uniref:VRR-NUC domain-containing protein n=1 Tax=Fusicatenibacter saccharivorans TaxID=1150298 RepID=UPI0015708783|nr:VRR-NUC domain-containing protein [Fusicatenibacter saccharivorans]NSD63411.1 VRR-NUC domain-containing protein [Fusicatenibacter saccharivorans]